ncbi:MAG: hypothetical protein DRJ49_02625 [Thermoprotei archaeon]|nr:MAG: hypothetical protein DRJ49_02625 [Thermoprotei archaeon]
MLVVTSILLLLHTLIPSIGTASPETSSEIDYEVLIRELSLENIKKHVEALSSFNTRVTGYEGYYKATDYIKSYLIELLGEENVFLYPYRLPVPVDRGSYLEIEDTGERIRVYPLWPNLVETSPIPEGVLRGARLLYVGHGELEEIKDDINGSVVLMEFNSGYNWIEMFNLGARAVIFIEPYETTNYEALSKQVTIPLYAPRFYILREDAMRLKRLIKREEVRVSIVSNFRFEVREVYNILAVVRHSIHQLSIVNGNPPETILLGTHYDSWSIVPSLAPGAEDAIGAAFLLELTRVLVKKGTYRNVAILFTSGRWEGLAGIREFIEKFFFQNMSRGLEIYLALFFDISSGNNRLGLFYTGEFYGKEAWSTGEYGGGGIEREFPTSWMGRINYDVKKRVGIDLLEEIDTYPIEDLRFLNAIPYRAYFDIEPLSMASYGLTFQLHTIHDIRIRQFTPFDLPEYIDWGNVKRQVITSAILGYALAKDVYLGKRFSSWEPLDIVRRERIFYTAKGFVKLIGQVLEHDLSSPTFYRPVPNALVLAVRPGNIFLPFCWIITKADKRGIFEINGLAPCVERAIAYQLWAYVMDEVDGGIIYAPDMGMYGAETFSNIVVTNEPIKGARKPIPIVVFRASTVVVYGAKLPITAAPPAYFNTVYEPREVIHPPGILGPFKTPEALATALPGGVTIQAGNVKVYESESQTQPWYYGINVDPLNRVLLIYLQPRRMFDIIVEGQLPLGEFRNFLVIEKIKSGNPGDIKIITLSRLMVSKSLERLCTERLYTLKKYRVVDPLIEEEYLRAISALNKSMFGLLSRRYREYYANVLISWAYLVKVYNNILDTLFSAGGSAVFLLAIIIPFAFLLERLIFEEKEIRKRLLKVLLITSITYVLLYVLHPGLLVVSNSLMTILGFSILILATPIIFLILSRGLELAKLIRIREKGLHFFERPGIDLLLAALSVGTSNMRKRRLRTILSLLSIVMLTFALTCFTSTVYVSKPMLIPYPIERKPPYQGILIKSPIYIPISDDVIKIIEELSDGRAVISERIFYYTQPMIPGTEEPSTYVFYGDRAYLVYAILGLSPNEKLISKIDKYMVTERYFTEESMYVAIISDVMARELLGVEPEEAIGETIRFMGIPLTIINIYNKKMLEEGALDIDGVTLLPIDPAYYEETAEITPSPEILILPVNLLRTMPGANIRSIAVRIDDRDLVLEVAHHLMNIYPDISVFISIDGGVFLMSRMGLQAILGAESMLVPLILVALIILSSMLGSIYERLREIGVYSSLGLSPAHVSFMFLSELMVYAIVGSLIGYLIGLGGANVLMMTGLIPRDIVLNYSSSFLVVVLSLIILSTIASAAYPLLKSARLVTPSIERKWRVRTKPLRDIWNIPLPAKIDPEEIHAVVAYIKEYFDVNKVPTTGNFYVEDLAKVVEGETENIEYRDVITIVHLPPWGAGLSQEARVRFYRRRGAIRDRYSVSLIIKLLTGMRETWIRSNYRFADEVRKQLLLWKSLRPGDKKIYFDKGRRLR